MFPKTISPSAFVPRILAIVLAFGAGSASAQNPGEVATSTSIYTVEASYSAGGNDFVKARVVIEFAHVPGATFYSAQGWGPQQGARRWSLTPAHTSVPAEPQFPKAITAQPGNLLYILASGVAFANDEDEINEMYADLEADFRISGYAWTVYGQIPDTFRSWVTFEPDTVSVGETFEAKLNFDNYITPGPALENIVPKGPLTATSEDEGSVTVESGPTPESVGTLGYASSSSMTYTMVAESAGTVRVEGLLEAAWDYFYPDIIESVSVCGEFETTPCTVFIEESSLIVNDTGDGDDTDPGDGICDGDNDAEGPQCTLRAALQEAEAAGDDTEIGFDIEDPFVISVESPLPIIGDGVTLDATTQPGWIDSPIVRIDGSNAGEGSAGLVVDGNNVTIRGFMITGFDSHGILVSGGSAGLLETLIVGSDASGSGGMGNGGDGIHISGGTGLTIGGEEASDKSASGAFNIGSVISVDNLLNGLYAANTANATLIRNDVRAVEMRAGRAGKGNGSASQAIAINLTVQNLVVGVLGDLGTPIAHPNGRNGICLLGISDALFDRVRVSDATMNAFEITASQRINIRRMFAGLRVETPLTADHIGRIGGSILKVFESLDISVGSESASDAPVQGVGAQEWFMDVQDSEHIDVGNLMAGVSANMSVLPSTIRSAMRNLAGGIFIHNTPFATIGRTGVPTILANNGGNTSMPQAGLFASGPLTESLRALNLHIGTMPDGLKGIGNLGSGMVLADGIREAFLGGENPVERIVSAGNMGYGYLFRDVGQTIPTKDGKIIASINAIRLVSDMVPGIGDELAALANSLSGFCLLRVQGMRMNKFSVGPSGRHGIETIDSSDLEMLAGTIGSFFEKPIESPADLMGPAENGVSISGGARIALGGPVGGPVANIMNIVINNVGGSGVVADGIQQLDMSNLGVGVDLLGSPESQAALSKMGSTFEAIRIQNTLRATMRGLRLLGNGAQSPDRVGALLVESSSNVELIQSLLGEMNENGSPERANIGTAVKSILSDSILISLSRIVGHETGIESLNSTMTLDDNRMEFQGILGGVGDAVKQLGGFLEARRNTLSGNTGAAFAIQDAAGSIIRFNNIAGNAIGIAADAIEGNKGSMGQGTPSSERPVLAPDNWWGDPSGPGGAGPGSGDSVSEGVLADTWLTSAAGMVISPEQSAVEAAIGAMVVIPVRFATPLLQEDVINVAVSDERGWVTSSTSFMVDVSGSVGNTHDLEVTVGEGGADRVTIVASSNQDPTLEGEAVVVIAPPGSVLPLETPVSSGDDVLDIDAGGAFQIGGELLINPGGVTEETAIIAGFGSILLETPLRFPHAAGEVVAPANRMSVDREDEPDAVVPAIWRMDIYPNPVDRSMSILVEAPRLTQGRIEVFDLIGRRVALLQDSSLTPGRHEIGFDVSVLPPGVYVVRMRGGSRMLTRLMTVVH